MNTSLKWMSRGLMVIGFVAVLLIAAGIESAYAQGPIDTFADAQSVLTVSYTDQTKTSVVSGSMLGGKRRIRIDFVPYVGGSVTRTASTDVSEGTFSHSQQSQVKARTLVTWDGVGNETLSPSGLGGVNLTANGQDRFFVEILSCDRGTTLTIDVYTDADYWSRGTLIVPANTYDGIFELAFSSFADQGTGGGANFASAGAITMLVDGQIADMDITIDFFGPYDPTAVTLADFSATPQGDAVLVAWETASELDNLGFNLYRGENAAGPWMLLNAALIPAQNPGAVFGAVYEWLDADVTRGATAYYRLEDVDIHGVSTFHGPVSVTVAPLPSSVALTGFGAAGWSALPLLLLVVAGSFVLLRRR